MRTVRELKRALIDEYGPDFPERFARRSGAHQFFWDWLGTDARLVRLARICRRDPEDVELTQEAWGNLCAKFKEML
jgi:hypothetical protein